MRRPTEGITIAGRKAMAEVRHIPLLTCAAARMEWFGGLGGGE